MSRCFVDDEQAVVNDVSSKLIGNIHVDVDVAVAVAVVVEVVAVVVTRVSQERGGGVQEEDEAAGAAGESTESAMDFLLRV